ncbi:MAG: hypothetical protein J5658_03970 [Prevotella sp.]|nr:hypothetical protein [Prevotella sp.]
MWRSIDRRPTEQGIYVVARFEGDKMVSYDTNWALADGYFGPNNIGWQERIEATHWMPVSEYRKLLENAPKEAFSKA